MIKIKQIIISISVFTIALALIIGVLVPLSQHGTATAQRAVSQGEIIKTGIDDVFK